jgi:hypothetical protein
MAVGADGGVLFPPGVRITIVILMVDPSWRFRLDDLSYWHVDSFGRDGGRDSPAISRHSPLDFSNGGCTEKRRKAL